MSDDEDERGQDDVDPVVDESLPHEGHAENDHADQSGATESAPQFKAPSRNIRDLFNPPRNIAAIRQLLFEVTDKIELHTHEFDLYFPYVDNVWVRQHRAGSDKTGRYKTDYYACRLQRPTYTPKAADKPRPEGTPTRKKQIREGGKCHMKLKVVRRSRPVKGPQPEHW